MANPSLAEMTPKARLVDLLLQQLLREGLHDTIRRLRQHGMSWREIAERITDLTGVRVTYESVRLWQPDEAEDAA